jgi:hypothetical protein
MGKLRSIRDKSINVKNDRLAPDVMLSRRELAEMLSQHLPRGTKVTIKTVEYMEERGILPEWKQAYRDVLAERRTSVLRKMLA